MRTRDQIIEDAAKRDYYGRGTKGMLLREDLQEFIDSLPPEADKRAEVEQFLKEVPFLTQSDRIKTISDLSSYGI